jgi:tetratricopeptide (TPR) repeat protein
MNRNVSGLGADRAQRLYRLCAVIAAITAFTGCAAHRSTITNTFVREGKPSIDLGGPVPGPETATYVAQLRKLAETARPRPKLTTPDAAEARDGTLRDRIVALQESPSAATHLQVALEYRRLGILDAAFSHLSAAIRLAPKDGAAYDLRARLWRAWGLPQLGVPDARKAVALSPQSASAWNTLGLLLEESGSADRGVSAYLRAIALDDRADYAWSNLCHAWTLRNDPAAAVRACRRALELDSTLQWAQINLFNAERLLAPASPPVVNEVMAGR